MGSTPTLGLVARSPRVVPAVVNVGGYLDRRSMTPVCRMVEAPASGQGRGYDVARLRHTPAACVEPRLMGCVDGAHTDVPSQRRVAAKVVQPVQEAKASAGHSSKAMAGCTDEGLPLGLASLERTPPGLPSCRTSQTAQSAGTSCRTSSSRGLRAWREAVPPLTRVTSSS